MAQILPKAENLIIAEQRRLELLREADLHLFAPLLVSTPKLRKLDRRMRMLNFAWTKPVSNT